MYKKEDFIIIVGFKKLGRPFVARCSLGTHNSRASYLTWQFDAPAVPAVAKLKINAGAEIIRALIDTYEEAACCFCLAAFAAFCLYNLSRRFCIWLAITGCPFLVRERSSLVLL